MPCSGQSGTEIAEGATTPLRDFDCSEYFRGSLLPGNLAGLILVVRFLHIFVDLLNAHIFQRFLVLVKLVERQFAGDELRGLLRNVGVHLAGQRRIFIGAFLRNRNRRQFVFGNIGLDPVIQRIFLLLTGKELIDVLRILTERTARTSNQTEYKRQAQSSKMDIWFENK